MAEEWHTVGVMHLVCVCVCGGASFWDALGQKLYQWHCLLLFLNKSAV